MVDPGKLDPLSHRPSDWSPDKHDKAEPPPVFRVFIVDDHPLFRLGLASILRSEGTFTVVGEAEDGPDALEKLRRGGVDVVMLDVSLKSGSGLELLKLLKAELPQLPVLIMSMHDASLYAERAMRAGASGYLTKDAPAPQVVQALRKVLAKDTTGAAGVPPGERFGPRRPTRPIAAPSPSLPEASPSPRPSELALLSDRELEVLECIGRGFSTRECAERLHVSIKTIEAHQAHIKAKLKLQDANRLRRFAAVWVAHERPEPSARPSSSALSNDARIDSAAAALRESAHAASESGSKLRDLKEIPKPLPQQSPVGSPSESPPDPAVDPATDEG